jgi:hypothetical protein
VKALFPFDKHGRIHKEGKKIKLKRLLEIIFLKKLARKNYRGDIKHVTVKRGDACFHL